MVHLFYKIINIKMALLYTKNMFTLKSHLIILSNILVNTITKCV